MIIKLFEVRDRGTFLPIFAIDTVASNEGQRYLLRRCGFHPNGQSIIIARLNGEGNSSAEAYKQLYAQWKADNEEQRPKRCYCGARAIQYCSFSNTPANCLYSKE